MPITLIAGSTRANASSTMLLRYIGGVLKSRQATVTFIDLAELQLPLFSVDRVETHPNASALLDACEQADGLILATPEYHGSISGALKNALDFVNAGQLSGKPVLSVSSAGGPVGISSLTHLQTIVRNMHGVNCTEWISLGYGSQAFGPDGTPLDEGLASRTRAAVDHFMDLTLKLAPAHVEA